MVHRCLSTIQLPDFLSVIQVTIQFSGLQTFRLSDYLEPFGYLKCSITKCLLYFSLNELSDLHELFCHLVVSFRRHLFKVAFAAELSCVSVVSNGHSGALFGSFLRNGVYSIGTSPFHMHHHWVSLLLHICSLIFCSELNFFFTLYLSHLLCAR